jgi:hypothetical protein
VWLCGFPQNLVAIFVVAGLSYWCVERPFERRGDGRKLRDYHDRPPMEQEASERTESEAVPV